MRQWLPWAILVLLGFAVAAVPWRKPDPKDEFVMAMLRNLANQRTLTFPEDSAEERPDIEYRTSAGRAHSAGSTHV